MSEFKRLLVVLEKELSHHEKLLELLNRERAAIVTLNPEQIENLNSQKEEILVAAKECEERRRELLRSLSGAKQTEDADSKTKPAEPRFLDVVGGCREPEVRKELAKVGSDLKQTAEVVRDMNNHNAQLIKQSLGLISSTLSIIRSTPGSELPTYGQRGQLRDNGDDPAFSGRSRGVTREA